MAKRLFGIDFWDFESFAENVQKGDLVIGMANGYQDYGVFITIGGSLRGLVPIRYVSKNPQADPKQVFPLNKNTEFLVQSVDKEKQRITLSSTEFVVGESRARRNPIDIDYNEPIDNSKVDVPLGDKEICFLIPNANDEKAEKSFRVLTTSIKMLGNDAPYIAEYFSEMPNLSERAEFIIEQSFVSSMPTQTFLRNLSYDGKGGNDVTRIGFRLARQEGDAWDTNLRLPMNRTFLFEGRILDKGKSFCVDKILLVANSDSALSYEVPLEIINLDSPAKVGRTFIYDLVNKMVSFTKYTSKKLSLWTEYLDWSQKVAELQIKGVKYVDVALDQARKQLVFCLMFKNENEFKQMQRILRRQEIMVFNNRVSTDRYEFKYDNGENGRSKPRVTGIDLGNSMGIVGKPFDLAVAEKTLSIPSLRKGNEDSVQLFLSDIKQNVESPFFVRWGYLLNDDDSELFDSVINRNASSSNVEEESPINDADVISNQVDFILSKYPKDGFLALSAVGELALINRFRRAIDQVKNGESFNPHLQEWLFDVSQARLPESGDKVEITRWLNDGVAGNDNQREAIEKMLSTKDLFLLQGPPGTGKTTVIAEAIFQFAIRGERVLLSSQSNDAVDNALERLVKTPEIRAIRLVNTRRRSRGKDEDDVLDKLSEDSALQYYYESLSEKISDLTLDKWSRIQGQMEECQKDLRILQGISERERDQRNLLEKSQERFDELQHDLENAKNELISAKRQNEDLDVEKKNCECFFAYLEDSDLDFALSDEHLNKAESILFGLNDSDFTLIEPRTISLNNNQRNQYLKFFVENVRLIKKCVASTKNAMETKIVGDDLELKHLQSELQRITDQMNTAASDDEYDELQQKQNLINRKIRDLRKKSQVVDSSLNDSLKSILSKSLQELFEVDKKTFLDAMTKKIIQIESEIAQLKQSLKSDLESHKLNDISAYEEKIKKIEGQLSIAETEISKIELILRDFQSQLIDFAQKYGVSQRDINLIVNAIESKNAQLEKEYHEDDIVRNDFGSLLKEFRTTLDEHAHNSKLLQGDNENYLDIYINSCNVVGFSCTADPSILTNKSIHDFDVVIIDEVSKATPPELLLPLMKARRVVLVGDHRQLPPMFKTNERSYEEIVAEVETSDDYTNEEKEALSTDNFKRYKQMVTSSLFKEYFEKAPKEIKASLLTQYRMHKDIMSIINRFYDGQLVCGISDELMETRKAHGLTIRNLVNRPFVVPEKHAFWIDSSALPDGTPIYESFVGASSSACNYLEENIIVSLLKKIDLAYQENGLGQKKVTVGVISFYQAAVNNLRKKIRREHFKVLDISTNTVDRFQGQEKNIVIASLVRSKEPTGADGKVRLSKHVLAFERINVAFSRAQNLLFIVGAKKSFEELEVTLPMMDSTNTRTIPVYKNIMADLHRNGCLVDSSCVIDSEMAAQTLKEYRDPKNSATGGKKGKNVRRSKNEVN